jgi:hypothetical protein
MDGHGLVERADLDRVAIRVPLADVPAAHVVWERDDGPQPRWRLADDAVELLASRPQFEVERSTSRSGSRPRSLLRSRST